jgi:hypothetical protein
VPAGAVTVRFSGRLKGKALAAGGFRITPGARDARGNRSTGGPLSVTVTAP